jgi:hypothetical protein
MTAFVAHNGVDWSESPKYLWPQPNHEDREFWEGARRGELRIQHCTTCGKHQHYPRFLCSHCRHARMDHRQRARNRLLLHRGAAEGVPPFGSGSRSWSRSSTSTRKARG